MAPSIPEWVCELEPVRHLPTNNGGRIRDCVHKALSKDPPSWAKTKLEASISKDVYKSNASGPTKKIILSVLADAGQGLQKHRKKPMKKVNDFSIVDIASKLRRSFWRRFSLKVYDLFKLLAAAQLISPASVIPYLNFRAIDCKLAVGAYEGLEKAFLREAHKLWYNLRSTHVKQPTIVRLVDALYQDFDSVYKEEVTGPVTKLSLYTKSIFISDKVENDVKNILDSASEMPEAPWNCGICKVCEMDKDDELVLLCDICDGEYHTYCLTPPGTVPEGNWFCPLCVSPLNVMETELFYQLSADITEEHPGEGSSAKLECIDATMEEKEDPETSEKNEDPEASEKNEDQETSENDEESENSEEKEDPKTSKAKRVVCSICGDRGFSELLVSCSRCDDISVHQYCVYEGFQIEWWDCEECAPLGQPKQKRKKQKIKVQKTEDDNGGSCSTNPPADAPAKKINMDR